MIYCNTNYVTVNFVANAILATGDAPAMTEFPGDTAKLATFADATYINIGTMTTDRTVSIIEAAKAANEANKPWVLDPVASGIGFLSDSLIPQLIDLKPAVIRANASEIIAVARLANLETNADSAGPKGVESADSVESAKAAAIALAKKTGGAVAVSGEVDLVTDGNRVVRVNGGSELLTKITGAGCSLGGVVAVFAAKNSAFDAALKAHALYSLASEIAASESAGTGSFQIHFLDALSQISEQQIASKMATAQFFEV